AWRLGGRRARCAQGGRTALDLPLAKGSARPLRPLQFRILGDLEFFPQLQCGEEPPILSVEPFLGRNARRRKSWSRHSTLREIARLQDVGGGKATHRYALQLSAARRCGRVPRRVSGADEYWNTDVLARDDLQNGRPMHPARQINRASDRFCPIRAGRLYADLGCEASQAGSQAAARRRLFVAFGEARCALAGIALLAVF